MIKPIIIFVLTLIFVGIKSSNIPANDTPTNATNWEIGDNWKVRVSKYSVFRKSFQEPKDGWSPPKLYQQYNIDIEVVDTLNEKQDTFFIVSFKPDTILAEAKEITSLAPTMKSYKGYYISLELLISKKTGNTKSVRIYYYEDGKKIFITEVDALSCGRFPFFAPIAVGTPFLRALPILWFPKTMEEITYYTNELIEVESKESALCYINGFSEGDTLINTINLRPHIHHSKFPNKHKLYWLDRHKWWVKYEYESLLGAGVSLRAELLEENLAN